MDYSLNSLTCEYPKNCCQICLAKSVNNLQHEEISNSLLERIHICFQIVLSLEKYEAPVICSNCIHELDIAYTFRLKCLSYNKRFYDLCDQAKENTSRINYEVATFINLDDKIMDKQVEITDKRHNDTIEDNYKSAELRNNLTGKIFQCSICKKTLKTESSLTKHNVSMHLKRKHLGKVTGSGSSRRYLCTKCSYSTPHSQTLVNHMRRHNGERPYHCECGKAFTQYSSLGAHRKTHSNSTFFTCSICGKQFKHTFTLKKHQLVHESGKFSCNICKKYLKSRQSLKDHIHRHYNVRNYNCEDCGDTFVTSSELLNHRQKHGLVKEVECHLCGYRTRTKKNLITHLKRHTGDKSYKCDLCLLSFYTSGDLSRHQRVHTREKPYKCPTCAQCFTHSPSLNKHMISVHGVDYKWAHIKWREKRNK